MVSKNIEKGILDILCTQFDFFILFFERYSEKVEEDKEALFNKMKESTIAFTDKQLKRIQWLERIKSLFVSASYSTLYLFPLFVTLLLFFAEPTTMGASTLPESTLNEATISLYPDFSISIILSGISLSSVIIFVFYFGRKVGGVEEQLKILNKGFAELAAGLKEEGKERKGDLEKLGDRFEMALRDQKDDLKDLIRR